MHLSPLARSLRAEIDALPVIDAHQHLPSEADYLAFQYSGANLFAGGYIWHDLESAGLSPEFKETLRQPGPRPVAEWWPVIRPYWEQVKHTSYSRALRVTVRDLYGLADVDDTTIDELAARVSADNTPGLYHRVLQEVCRARYTITSVDQASFPNDPGLRGLVNFVRFDAWDPVRSVEKQLGRTVTDLEDLAAAVQEQLRTRVAAGAVGFKMTVASHPAPAPVAAEAEFRSAQRGEGGPYPALCNYLFDRSLDVAAEADVPVAVHTGYWNDFRDLAPTLMFSFAARRRDVRFDMFHLGMPMVREAATMGKTLPNVTLNLTWCPIISQVMTARTLDEILDLVPITKIIAFGGDYRVAVQKTYGHLALAKECVASALAKRVESGDFDRGRALHIARLWFHDNPTRIYRLDAPKGQNA